MVSRELSFPPISEMRRRIGVVIPTWVADSSTVAEVQALLDLTLADSELFVQPNNCLVVVDGAPIAATAAERCRSAGAPARVLNLERNGGKAYAVARGIECLLENEALDFIAVRDHDNDHLAHDLPALQRLAMQMQRETGHESVAVIGGRTHVQRHLGFARGEFELLGNEVAFTATQLRLAKDDRVIDVRYWSAYEAIPDLQSGYKLYSREAASRFVASMREGATRFPECQLGQGAAELMPLLEVWMNDGVVGQVRRSAWERQPSTTFVADRAVAIKAGILAWCLWRTAITPAVARILFENALARRLWAKEEAGLRTLTAVANETLGHLAKNRDEEPLFISAPALSDYF